MDIIILLIAMIITLSSQAYINGMYNKTKNIRAEKNITGKEVARKILDENGLKNVAVKETSGVLTDHYDPKSKTVNLSSDIYSNNSIASISVAAHECGHAIQDKNGYFFLKMRHSIVPFVNIASHLGYIAIVLGVFFSALRLIRIGAILEIVILVFQVITLPVEFNASSRALKQLEELKITTKQEHNLCYKMLKAAALTYVAAVASTIMEILRLLLISRRDD